MVFTILLLFYFNLKCYGAEDDRTFGIPGEVTSEQIFVVV